MSISIAPDSQQKYKQFVINNELTTSSNEVSAVSDQLLSLKRSDVLIKLNGDEIVLFANSVDLNELNELQKKTNDPLIKIIVDKLLSIGSYGYKDGMRFFVGFNKERKVIDRKRKEKIRSRFYYSKDNSFINNNNDLPPNYVNKIIAGDSQQVLKDIPDNCIDLVFTSPPYNFGLDYQEQLDESHWEDYFKKLFGVFDECIRVLKYSGRIVINIQPLFSDYIPSHHIISNYFIKNRLIWKGEILWEKNNYNCKYTAWGSYKSPSSPYLKYTWEFLEIFSKGDIKKIGEKENIDITDEEFKNWVIAKWSIAPERNMKRFKHPAMFPEELARRVIKLFSYQNDIILDPFNGVGTTTLVAKKNQRRFLGIDISGEYCSIAKNRLDEILI